MSDNTASRVGWGVILGGEESALEEWRAALKQPFDPWVAEDRLILRSSALDRATTGTEAYDLAKALMDQVNGALAVSRGAPIVRLEGLMEVFSDGSCRPHQFVQLRATDARDKISMVIAVDGQPAPPPQPSNPQRWLSIAAEDDLLADALTYVARGDDWFDVYKALECLFGRFGGGKEGDFLALGWANPEKIKLLKRTADSWRHSRRGRLGIVPPHPPMERTEARDLLARLMARAFDEAEASTLVDASSSGAVKN